MKTKQYATHPLITQSELPSAILSALTIALLSALLFTSCSKHHYLELFLDPDGEPIENPGRILLSAPGVANPLLPAILTDPTREDRIVATVLHGQPVDVEAGTYNLLCALPTDGSNTEYFGTDAFTLNGTTISLPLLDPDGRLPQAPDVLTDATPVTVTSGRTIQTALTPALVSSASTSACREPTHHPLPPSPPASKASAAPHGWNNVTRPSQPKPPPKPQPKQTPRPPVYVPTRTPTTTSSPTCNWTPPPPPTPKPPVPSASWARTPQPPANASSLPPPSRTAPP